MSRQYALIETCDLCGYEQMLLEVKNEAGWNYYDGEDKWGYNTAIGVMCPECYQKYKDLLGAFAKSFEREEEA